MSYRRRVPSRIVTTSAAVYARGVMTDERGLAIGRQLEECLAYVASHRWDLAGEFVDDGVSGAGSSRPALTCILDEVCAGRVQAVVVSKLDRLGRSALLLGTFMRTASLSSRWPTGSTPGVRLGGSSARRSAVSTSSTPGSSPS